jgi:hypothetical protein
VRFPLTKTKNRPFKVNSTKPSRAQLFKARRKVHLLSDTEEARIEAGIAADPDNPEWTARDFRRAKPFGKVFPALTRKRRAPARKLRT